MARNGVQYQDVQRAIETLIQRGDTPSVQRIREVLGTGSFTTISDHLREWRTRREENRDTPLPQAIPERLQEALYGLWQQAQEEAHEALSFYRRQADEDIQQCREETRIAQRLAEDAEQRLQALGERFDANEARLEEKTTALARQESELAQLRSQCEDREQRLAMRDAQIEALSEERERQEREHQQTIEQAEQNHRKRLAQEESRHETAENRLMQLLDSARHEKQEAEKQSRRRQEQLEERIEKMTAQVEEQRRALQEEERKTRELSSQIKQSEKALQESHAREERLSGEITENEQEMTRLRTEIRVLQERLSRAPMPPFVY
ncbi:DNA-binding protein [Kushneria phosphatilytica]|uniref:KfrA N-terminal DNA-binding domain-containing protein n=1 Tax=Kushneria phosphatilytica TaxID=657387 RepID=A0A1S1NRQ4_9GAMM|nr:DNA-binding protein [Kushneria phosphatilytica]OHV11919.1 hypothetical protein BH688_04375 [Kushneria phosphatilytica]QEL11099.1 hypothetical protein FY550_08120 [Kushneria phosphatilytica]